MAGTLYKKSSLKKRLWPMGQLNVRAHVVWTSKGTT